MRNFVSSIFAGMILIVISVIMPILLIDMADTYTSRIEILDAMSNLCDSVSDSGVLTDSMVEDFNLALASTGQKVTTKIERYQLVVNPTPGTTSGEIYNSYIINADTTQYMQGDYFKVTVTGIKYNTFLGGFDKTLSRRVR